VLSGLDTMSHGILVWRSMIQWIGGMGIVAFAIILLPFLKVGGMQLFHTESSDKSEKIMPRSKDVVASILMVYIALTTACALCYYTFGMSWFDAINHAMTTISTAGFSTHDKSLGYYPQPMIHYTASLFMLLSALPFTLFIMAVLKRRFLFWEDEQVRALAGIVVTLVFVFTMWRWHTGGVSFEESLRHVLFTLSSIISTTGYASTDYCAWGSFAVIVSLFATYIGGAGGSTAGGPKTMRLIIAAKMVGRQIKAMLYPNGSFPVYYQGKSVDEEAAMNVLGFLSFYVFINVVLSIGVAMTGADFLTAVSSVATATGNVGNGVGPVVGPSGNFSSLSDTAKWILSLAMLLGRLEILTVVVLFTRNYWLK
jgi:trk system potassium uptake protein TrkH